MRSGTLLASSCLHVEMFVSRPNLVEIRARCRTPTASCPRCCTPSARVHSRYERTLADLPWQGVAVVLKLRVRRFFCASNECPRLIFAEQFPDLAAAYARRTRRLTEVVELIGFVLGGE